MSLTRLQALRSLQQSFRTGARPVARSALPRRTQQVVARRWASGGGGGSHGEPTSDIPWLIGATVVTVPCAYFLWPSSHAESGHHGGESHGDEHAEEHEEKEGGEEDESSAPAPAAAEDDDQVNDEAKTDPSAPTKDTSDTEEAAKETEQTAKPSGSQGESQPQAEGPDGNKVSYKEEEAEMKESAKDKGKIEGVQFKGSVAGGAPDDTRKREPDAKGGYKKRIDSGYGKNLGEGPQFADDGSDGGPAREAAASAKPPAKGSQGEISGKQYGLSNSPTRHSTQIDQDPEKSKKGEGSPETAKSMGTVDPSRPMAESDERGKK